MSGICLVDTSVFCEVLRVPGKAQDPTSFRAALVKKSRVESLLLPMATILETGNHIGQGGDGRVRRQVAQRFCLQVRAAVEGESPFTPTPFVSAEGLLEWLVQFPDWAMRGSGLGDLTILQEWERQCQLHPARRVYIWSKDGHLSGYDRSA